VTGTTSGKWTGRKGGAKVAGMDDDAPRRKTDKELESELGDWRWKAEARYRSKKPGHDYHEWADERDAAKRQVARLERILERRSQGLEDYEKPVKRRVPVERKIPLLTDLEQRNGVNLEEIVAEFFAKPPHLRYGG